MASSLNVIKFLTLNGGNGNIYSFSTLDFNKIIKNTCDEIVKLDKETLEYVYQTDELISGNLDDFIHIDFKRYRKMNENRWFKCRINIKEAFSKICDFDKIPEFAVITINKELLQQMSDYSQIQTAYQNIKDSHPHIKIIKSQNEKFIFIICFFMNDINVADITEIDSECFFEESICVIS